MSINQFLISYLLEVVYYFLMLNSFFKHYEIYALNN